MIWLLMLVTGQGGLARASGREEGRAAKASKTAKTGQVCRQGGQSLRA